jgi:hypothetical protein
MRDLRFDLQDALPIRSVHGDVQAELTSMEAASTGDKVDEMRFDVALRYPAGGPVFESFRVASLPQGAWLELPAGNRIAAAADARIVREQDGSLRLQYRLADPPQDWRRGAWVVRVPTLLDSASFEFESIWPQPPAARREESSTSRAGGRVESGG